MAYIPPVSLPQFGQNDYSRQLHAFAAGPGETIGQMQREATQRDQFDRNYSAQLERDQFRQMDANRRFDLDQQEFEAGGGSDGYYGTPIYTQDGKDNIHVYQLSKGGADPRAVDFGGGMSVLHPGMRTVDTGTGYSVFDPRRGTFSEGVPKDVAGQKAAEAEGKAQGEAAANLPAVEALNDRIIRTIDDVLNDPYLSSMTGPIEGRLPNVSAASNRVQSKLNMILGGTFLTAYNELRGGGQITEAEGQAAKEAYNTLQNMNVDDEDYVAALNTFRRELVKLTDLARQRAAGQTTSRIPPGRAISTIAQAAQSGSIPPEVGTKAIEAIQQGAPPDKVLKRIFGQ